MRLRILNKVMIFFFPVSKIKISLLKTLTVMDVQYKQTAVFLYV